MELETLPDELHRDEFDDMLYAAHAEITSLADLETQRGTPIPTLMNQFYKFIQNPSTVSIDTFKRMVDTDDTLGSGIDFLTTCLAARIGRYEHKNPEITEWMNKALEKIKGGFASSVKEMLSATWVGFCIQEKVWGNDENLGFVVKKLVALPPGTLLFETDRSGELTDDGILQFQQSFTPAGMYGNTNNFFGFISNSGNGRGNRNDPFARFGDAPFPIRTGNSFSYMSIRIPKLKCIHYAFDAQGKFGNPYGRSLLRRAYKWYVMKDAFLQMLSVALDRKGTPLTIVFADPSATLQDAEKFDGTNAKGKAGKGIRADVAAANAFKNIHNDSMIVLPGKKGQTFDIQVVDSASNAADFIAAIDLCNRSMLRALLIPSLIFANGDGTGSYALGQEHARTFDKILDGMVAGCKEALLEQLIFQLLALNFPRSMWEEHGLGDFQRAELTPEEIEKEMAIYEKAVNMGVVDLNDLGDLNTIRSKMRLPSRETPIEPRMNPLDDSGLPREPGVESLPEGDDEQETDGDPNTVEKDPPDEEEMKKGAKLWRAIKEVFV